MKKMNQIWLFPFASILMLFLQLASGQDVSSSAQLSTTWTTNNLNTNYLYTSIIFYNNEFSCGFYCGENCPGTFVLAIIYRGTEVVWAANRNNPVKLNATLQFTSQGDLVLRDAEGTLAWSTNTSHMSVASLNLTDTGNLVLYDVNNSVVWQSFDHPTDTLLTGQRLVSGQKLTSSISDSNWSQGLYSLLVTDKGLFAFIESKPAHAYVELRAFGYKKNINPSYVKLKDGSLDVFILVAEPSNPDESLTFPKASSAQFMRLMPDGRLSVFQYESGIGWEEVKNLFADYLGECGHPTVCGKYGICTKGQCSCPKSESDPTNYFREIVDRHPDHGCLAVTPLTCNGSEYHTFVELEYVTYFTFSAEITHTDKDGCRKACLRNCSCKAAMFRYGSNPSNGDCYLPSDIFSLINNEHDDTWYNFSALIKVQAALSPIAIPVRENNNRPTFLGSAIGGFFLLLIILGVVAFIIQKKKNAGKDEEDYLDHIPGMPTRFSHEDLKIATENFTKKLGEGGFGSVFQGVLKDGTRIAVKCLDGIDRVKKSFFAEVESIGSIHHVNLVRLIGFCAEKSHRLLVYEHLTNGSLDRWIYRRSQDIILDWNCRRKIIEDVAKGLSYLHEDCRQKIVHLDIKPQNILLDENFNAKLSDFGLSKLIDRDQSHIVTTMRGTPGYLAPEWLSAVITEKVDVYSFGIVLLEIICGRKNFEPSEPEEWRHLLSLFKIKAEEGQLFDLIDKRSQDMQSQGAKVVEMMQVAARCLQSDYSKRPSMSMVVRVLEGGDVQSHLDYSSLNSQTPVSENCYADTTPLLPSLLSAPR